MSTIIDFRDYLAQASKEDMTPAVRRALEALPAQGGALRFPKGIYHFWPDCASERHYFISNNDHGLKRIAFELRDRRDVIIDGQGSEFIFHGRIMPFVIDGSANVTLKNLTVDYDRPFFSQGQIVAVADDHVDLRIDRQVYPWRIENGRLIFSGPNWDGADYLWVLLLVQFNPRTRAMAPGKGFQLGRFQSVAHIDKELDKWSIPMTASELGGDMVRLTGDFDGRLMVGYTLVMSHEFRLNPGVLITESENVLLEGITLHHVGAMGVIAQLSRDITLRRVEARLREKTERLVSVLADATHFVNCEGTIRILDCVFENMLDDATNIHGICTTVARVLGPATVELELMHFQQHGINLYRPGDRVEFIDRQSLQPLHAAEVRSSRMINRQLIEVTFTEDLGGRVKAGDAADNVTRYPEIEIRGCRTGHNRPRGFLVTSHRRTVIEGNEFYNSSAGVWVAGDANYWFESGPVRDVVIRKNRFKGSGYGDGNAAIVIAPELPKLDEAQPCYHRSIVIEDNEFLDCVGGAVQARSVDGLTMRGNTWQAPAGGSPEPVRLEGCRNVALEELGKG